MRVMRRALVAAVLVLAIAAIVWGPAYARGLSLVVRAADLDGWLKAAADAEARAWTADAATTIPTRHGAIPARLYRPAGTIRRAAVLTPGVHAMGIDEPRLKGLAGDLAASGVAILTIAIPDLVRYRFTPAAVDQIEDAAAWLAAQSELAPDGRVGLMGISFAGGLSVVAAGRPAVRDRVAYVFSFGGHGDLARVLRYLCTGLEPPGPDQAPGAPPHFRAPHDYGVAVILLGLADRIVPADQVDALRRGLVTFLTASQLTLVDMARAQATFRESQAIAAALPEPSGTLMRHVNERNTRALGAELLPVLERIGAEEYPPSMSAEHSPPPAAPVYLLHGSDDTVIPAVETRLLARHLEAQGVTVHALLSGLITHAEVDRSAAAAETWRLVGFWTSLLGE
jgi:dienelactone hydrolase